MNFYPFHLGDYKKRTHYLSLMEDLCYRRMIDLYYLTEAPLPLEIDTIARMIGMRDHIIEVTTIISDFFVKTDAGYVSDRCEEEIEKYKARASRASKLAEKRWHSTEKPCDVVCDTHTKSNANQEPVTSIDTKPVSKRKVADAPVVVIPESIRTEAFQKAWNSYLAYRKEMRFKALKPTSVVHILLRMATWGEEASIEAINTSIRNGWQGIFEPRSQVNAVPAQPANKPSKYANMW
jgi:uncharacterized protein YdaU (DUF1376 family)